MQFGDKFKYRRGVPFLVVFLHQDRKGLMVFGTENGGQIKIDENEFKRLSETEVIERVLDWVQ